MKRKWFSFPLPNHKYYTNGGGKLFCFLLSFSFLKFQTHPKLILQPIYPTKQEAAQKKTDMIDQNCWSEFQRISRIILLQHKPKSFVMQQSWSEYYVTSLSKKTHSHTGLKSRTKAQLEENKFTNITTKEKKTKKREAILSPRRMDKRN